jgi:hypothetical protein
MRRKLNRESFRERIEGGFCSRVVGSISHSNNGVVGRSNDDRSRSMLDHVNKRGLTNVKAAGYVCVDQASPFIKFHVTNRRAGTNPGIAENVVDFAKLLHHLSAPVLDGKTIPHINYSACCFSARASNYAASFRKSTVAKIA